MRHSALKLADETSEMDNMKRREKEAENGRGGGVSGWSNWARVRAKGLWEATMTSPGSRPTRV